MNFHVGSRIKYLLNKKGISQKELSQILERTPPYVTLLLRKETVNSGLIIQLAEIFDVPISFFYGDENDLLALSDNSKKEVCPICKEKGHFINVQTQLIESLHKQINFLEKQLISGK